MARFCGSTLPLNMSTLEASYFCKGLPQNWAISKANHLAKKRIAKQSYPFFRRLQAKYIWERLSYISSLHRTTQNKNNVAWKMHDSETLTSTEREWPCLNHRKKINMILSCDHVNFDYRCIFWHRLPVGHATHNFFTKSPKNGSKLHFFKWYVYTNFYKNVKKYMFFMNTNLSFTVKIEPFWQKLPNEMGTLGVNEGNLFFLFQTMYMELFW